MDRNDGFSLWGDGFFYQVGINQVGMRIDIDKDGGGTESKNTAGGGEEGIDRDDNLIARPDPDGTEGDDQGIGAGGQTDGMFDFQVGGDFGFESLLVGTENELAGLQDALDGSVYLGFDGVILGDEVK